MAKRNKPTQPVKLAPVASLSWAERLRSIPLLCLLLAVVTFAVYLPALRNDFVNYDDADYVTANSHVQNGLTLENIKWAFTTGHASNWHPITWLSHMLDCQLFGQNAAMHHLVSLLFHIANTLLLFLLLNRLTATLWRSAMVAALFALHPLHVESVAWASERKDVLSAFFFFLTLLTYTGSRRGKEADFASRSKSASSPRRLLFYLLTLALFALGLMSKPMLVTVPFVLLLLDFWPLQRFQFKSAPPILHSTSNRSVGQLLLEKVPFLILSAASSIITFKVQQHGGAVSTSISFGARIANAVVSYGHYILDMFWPSRLSVLYPHPGTWPVWEIVASAVFLLMVTTAALFALRKHPYLPVGWFWFLGMLVPAIGLVQVGIQCRADRYTYLPLIGLFLMLVWAGAELITYFSKDFSLPPGERAGVRGNETSANPSRSQYFDPVLAIGTVFFPLAVCAFLTSCQIGYWRNSETLFRRAVQVTDKNYLAYNNLGYYLSNRGETAAAMENYRKSLQINPNYEDALNNLGYAYANQKKYPEAIAEYEKALRIRPNHPEVHNNLGNALADVGRIDDAIAHYSITLQQKPDHADAHNNLGVALSMKGRYAEAIDHFRAALRYKPSDASAHSNLGNAYAIQGIFALAIPEYEQAIRMNPKDSQAHNNLANCLSSQGKLEEAISQYSAALALKPNDPEIHFNLGMALARQGKRPEALAQYTEALRLKPDYAEAQTQLRALGGAPPQ